MGRRYSRRIVDLRTEPQALPAHRLSKHTESAMLELARLAESAGQHWTESELREAVTNLGGFLRILARWDAEQKQIAVEGDAGRS